MNATVLRRTTLLALLCVAVAAAQPAPSRATVLDYLPGDTIAYLRVKGFGAFWKELAASPIRDRIANAPIPDVANQFAEARTNVANFRAYTGADLFETGDAIIGKDFVAALFPDKTGVFATFNPDAEALRAAVALIVNLQIGAGEITVMGEETYRGVVVQRQAVHTRRPPDALSAERFLAQDGGVLLVTTSQSAMKKALDAGRGAVGRIADTPQHRQAAPAMQPAALGTVYVNLALLHQSGLIDRIEGDPLRNPVVRFARDRLRENLAYAEYLVMNGFGDGRVWRLTTHLAYDPARTPPLAKSLLGGDGGDLDILRLVPPDAALYAGNRCDKRALWNALLEVLHQNDPALAAQAQAMAQQLAPMFSAMDFDKELLPQIGAQALLFVIPGASDGAPSALLAVEMNNGQTIHQALRTWIGTVAGVNQMEARQRNQPPKFSVRRATHDGAEITSLVIDQPPFTGWFAPSVAMAGKYLLIATSDAAIRAALDASKSPGSMPPVSIEGALSTRGRVDAGVLIELLRRHRDFLIRQAVKKGAPEAKAQSDLANLEFLLGFFRQARMSAAHQPGCLNREVVIEFAAP